MMGINNASIQAKTHSPPTYWRTIVNPAPLILASTSAYRAQSLSQLGLEFRQIAPKAEETALKNEPPEQLAKRLSKLKAESIAAQHPEAIVIGADQVGWMSKQQLHKPLNAEIALRNLMDARGKSAVFYSGLAVASPTKDTYVATIQTQVRFRRFDEAQLRQYVFRDNPLNCAGAFKIESLGIVLFEYVKSDDPTALVGLPLITLSGWLSKLGVNLL